MRVAVAQWTSEQGTVAAKEGEVAAPGVDADALDADAALGGHLQSLDNLVVEGIEVPVEVSSHGNERVVEPGELLHAHMPVIERPDNRAPRRGAEVYGEIVFHLTFL